MLAKVEEGVLQSDIIHPPTHPSTHPSTHRIDFPCCHSPCRHPCLRFADTCGTCASGGGSGGGGLYQFTVRRTGRLDGEHYGIAARLLVKKAHFSFLQSLLQGHHSLRPVHLG